MTGSVGSDHNTGCAVDCKEKAVGKFSAVFSLRHCNEWQIRSTPELDVLAPFCI